MALGSCQWEIYLWSLKDEKSQLHIIKYETFYLLTADSEDVFPSHSSKLSPEQLNLGATFNDIHKTPKNVRTKNKYSQKSGHDDNDENGDNQNSFASFC